MNEKKQLVLIWISTLILFVVLVVVTIITNNTDVKDSLEEIKKNRISSIVTSNTIYPEKSETLSQISDEDLVLYRTVNINDYNQLASLANDMGLTLNKESCVQSYCTWKDKENLKDMKYDILLDFDPGYQKITVNTNEGLNLENIGITSEEQYVSDPTIIPENFLKYYLSIDSEYYLQSQKDVGDSKIYNYNRLIDGKKLFILSSIEYSDFVVVQNNKIISASFHMFTFAADQKTTKISIDQKSFDNILLSKSNIVTFMQTDYSNILGGEEEIVSGDVEYIKEEIPSPSSCSLTEGEIGYYLNTSTSEKTLVPIYRGTCIGNTQYEGEEYIVNGLVMFELF